MIRRGFGGYIIRICFEVYYYTIVTLGYLEPQAQGINLGICGSPATGLRSIRDNFWAGSGLRAPSEAMAWGSWLQGLGGLGFRGLGV